MPEECETIVKGFKEASIVETIKDSETIYERVENPFRSQSIFRRLNKYCFMFEEKKDGEQSSFFTSINFL